MPRSTFAVLAAVAFAGAGAAQVDPWAPPAAYYQNVSGEGTALRQSLLSAMSSGHIQRRYGDFRQSARFHDADPDRPGNILLAYNRQSIGAGWTSGATWNREHVWPQSRQPGSASNSSRGNLGDPHALRPCNPGINSSRSNKPFGLPTTTGGFRSLGSYWFPGDRDKGDIARSLFYSSVRYNLALVNGFPSGSQMGDLASHVAHHYSDVPDEFERRRNHVIYSRTENPSYYTNNRNAFIDLPGVVWSVFVDDSNDSQLFVGDTPDADGGSSVVVSRRVIDGTPALPATVTLNRGGADGVYYLVRSDGAVVTDQGEAGGFSGAFGVGEGGPRAILIEPDASVLTGPGLYEGTVTIDNLDVTTGLGPGRGGLDADDVIEFSLEVLGASRASFDGSLIQVSVGVEVTLTEVGTAHEIRVPIHALDAGGGFTAGLIASQIGSSGFLDRISLATPAGVIPAGGSRDAVVTVTPPDYADAAASFVLLTSDDASVAGSRVRDALSIVVSATWDRCNAADLTGPIGVLSQTDASRFVELFFESSPRVASLASPFDLVSQTDVTAFVDLFFQGCTPN